jgi:hypothetical protein
LVRLLHGKPLYEKPQTGKPPAYITEALSAPSHPVSGKFSIFKMAFLGGHKGLKAYRGDFLDACASYVDSLRPRAKPTDTEIPQKIVGDFRKLTPIRNLLVDWILLEGGTDASEGFESSLLEFLERLLELKGRPEVVSSWDGYWYEGHRLFVYETFLYIIAALLKAGAFKTLNAVLMGNYLVPTNAAHEAGKFTSFELFYAYSEMINPALASDGRKYHSEAAELMKRSADRSDVPFQAVMEADALAYLAASLRGIRWYPQTHYYSEYGNRSAFFIRASQHRHFAKLVAVLGVESGDKLRELLAAQRAKGENTGWGQQPSFENLVNLEALDTIS